MKFHDKPFDEGTLVKLSLFRDYLREWLPVFLGIADPYYTTINIFDFFAGPGRDVDGQDGSPVIALREIEPYHEEIRSKGLSVNLFLNEYQKKKTASLEAVVKEYSDSDLPVAVDVLAEDFGEVFWKTHAKMKMPNTANFIFLDQTGVKHITPDVFTAITTLKQTDFLFFISSSTINRFCENEDIRQYVNISSADIEHLPYEHIHRRVCEYYRNLLPAGREYYLAPFSIKKGANIYGLIFGSGHVLGIDKFLHACWRQDPERGEANYDIDDDKLTPDQPSLFDEMDRPKKLNSFAARLSNAILSGEVRSNKDIYRFSLLNGCLPSHGKDVVSGLIKEGKLPKQRIPAVSYNAWKAGEGRRAGD